MPRRPSPQLLLEGLGTIPRCPAHLVCLSHEGLPILPRDQVRPLLLSSLTTPLLCPSLSPSFFICQVEESPTPAPAMPLGTQRCLPSIENLALGQNLKGLMATLSPHNRFTAIQTGWCWTREGRSLKPYTTSAASSRALRCPWAPKRTPPGSAGTSWTVSRRWLMVRRPVGSEKRLFLSSGWGWRRGVGGSRRSWEEMECSSLGSSWPSFCP